LPLRFRAVLKWMNFNFGVSYRLGENDPNWFLDCANVITVQNILRTRPGFLRFNDTAVGSGAIKSLSFFKKPDGTRVLLAKVGTEIFSVPSSGASTVLVDSLTTSDKHRAITINNRHIIASGASALAYYDGTNYGSLGIGGPAAPSVAASGSGNDLDAADYRVALTFYASSIGAESNRGAESAIQTVAANEQIDITSIPATSAHAKVDFVRVYVRDYTNDGAYFFHSEISLGTTTATVDENLFSSQQPPTRNGVPRSGGATHIARFGRKVAYVGNTSFPSDLFIGEEDIPDAVNDSITFQVFAVDGLGEPTGLATGYYDDASQVPYLAIFKKRSISIYSEAAGSGLTLISNEIGCVSGDTISVINGDIYFQSESGARVLRNGRLLKEKGKGGKSKPATLGEGSIDNIYTDSGFIYELNKAASVDWFSAYYSTLNHWLNFVSEGSNNSIQKAYNYEVENNAFKPLTFGTNYTAATIGEDSDGEEVLFVSDDAGFIYTYSIKNTETDQNRDLESQQIAAFFILSHQPGTSGDFDATYQYREFILDAITNTDNFTVRYFPNFDFGSPSELTYSFPDPGTGFILDVSRLDEGTFTDGRTMVRARGGPEAPGQCFGNRCLPDRDWSEFQYD